MRQQPSIDSLIGETCVAVEDMAINAVGKAELRGTPGSRNAGDKPLARGQRCTVERVEGLTIFVRAEQN